MSKSLILKELITLVFEEVKRAILSFCSSLSFKKSNKSDLFMLRKSKFGIPNPGYTPGAGSGSEADAVAD